MKKILTLAVLMFTALFHVCLESIYAQNTGPIAPETMQFEPADASDMVSLVTGDVSYVIPVMTVPGPEGGYPIVLSYHAGVTMDMEASWVGLGWNVNPGVINRSVVGIPDDGYGLGVITNRFSDLGIDETNFINIQVPLRTFSVGLQITWGTNWSVGGQVSFSSYNERTENFKGNNVGFSIGDNGNGVAGSLSYNDLSVGAGGGKGINASYSGNLASVGVSLDSKGLDADFSFNFPDFSSKSSLDQNTCSPTSIYQVTHGKTNDFFLIKYGFETIHSFYYANSSQHKFGLMYLTEAVKDNSTEIFEPAGSIDASKYYGVQSFKRLVDVVSYPSSWMSTSYYNYNGSIDYKADGIASILLPGYDAFYVSSQGISGKLSARFYKGGLIYGNSRIDEYYYENQNWGDNILSEILYYYDNDYLTKAYELLSDKHYLYFDNKNEGSLIISGGEFLTSGGFTGGVLNTSDCEYNASKQRKVNGNFVQWFKNSELVAENKPTAILKGFIETESIKDDVYPSDPRKNDKLFAQKGIGAITITAVDGKSYHYSLPVYQFEEVMRMEENSTDYMERLDLGMYATAWLLTAITGPDFVDQGTIGMIDDNDLGFWVKFDYGKWTDGYIWHLPYQKPIYNEGYKWGRKQIYYLNSIKTKTHTALFVKSSRKDGASSHPVMPHEYTKTINVKGVFDEVIDVQYPLKLDKIVLIKNEVLSNLGITYTNTTNLVTNPNKTNSVYWWEKRASDGQFIKEIYNRTYKINQQNNVLDITDISGENLVENSLRTIHFAYDDSHALCENTPNSSLPNKGKLTLKSLQTTGKEGKATIPPYVFTYNDYENFKYDELRMDHFGFDYQHPEVWSLSSILSPIGSRLLIEYESDSYNKEIATGRLEHKFDVQNCPTTTDESENKVIFDIEVPYNMKDIFAQSTEFKGDIHFSHDNMIFGTHRIDQIYDKVLTLISYNASTRIAKFSFNGETINGTNQLPLIIHEKVTGACIKMPATGNICAGGLRAKKITLSDQLNNAQSITSYDYNSSGIISFLPCNFSFVPLAYEQLAPIVLYENVKVNTKNSNEDVLGSVVYNFEVPKAVTSVTSLSYNMDGYLSVTTAPDKTTDDNPFLPSTYDDLQNIRSKWYSRGINILNNTDAIGRIKSIETRNCYDQVIAQRQFKYLPADRSDNGIIQETFYYTKLKKSRFLPNGDREHKFDYTSITKTEVPNVLEYVETTRNGLKTTIYLDKYDRVTGAVRESRLIQPDGSEYKSVHLPAWLITTYRGTATSDDDSNIGMGSKVWNIYNKNMLSQEAAAFNLLNTNSSASPIWKVIGTGIQTWKSSWDNNGDEFAGTGLEDQTGIWRKHKTFVWKGNVNSDGTYNSSYFNAGGRYSPENIASYWSDFNDIGVNGWQKTSEIITYNKYSLPIQARDINDNYTSTKTNLTDGLIIANAAFARYNQFAFSGAEENVASGSFFGGNVKNAGGSVNSTYKHTGQNSLSVSSGNKGFSFVLTPRSGTYKVSVWVKGTSADYDKVQLGYNGSTIIPATNYQYFQAGDWFMVSGTISLGTSNSEIFCKANGAALYFDDFRVQPVDAIVTAYVYDARDNVSAILDNDNLAVKYEYDEGDRLIATYKETPKGFEKVSGNDYNFSRCSCAAGFSWTPVTLTADNRNVAFASFDNSSNCTYNWSFGDGTANSTLKNPTHTFDVSGSTSNGYYDVSLTVTDSKGKSATETNRLYFSFAKVISPGPSSTIYKGSTTFQIYTSYPGYYRIEQFKDGSPNSQTYRDFTTTQYGATTVISADWMYLSDPPNSHTTCVRIRYIPDNSVSSNYCGYCVVN